MLAPMTARPPSAAFQNRRPRLAHTSATAAVPQPLAWPLTSFSLASSTDAWPAWRRPGPARGTSLSSVGPIGTQSTHIHAQRNAVSAPALRSLPFTQAVARSPRSLLFLHPQTLFLFPLRVPESCVLSILRVFVSLCLPVVAGLRGALQHLVAFWPTDNPQARPQLDHPPFFCFAHAPPCSESRVLLVRSPSVASASLASRVDHPGLVVRRVSSSRSPSSVVCDRPPELCAARLAALPCRTIAHLRLRYAASCSQRAGHPSANPGPVGRYRRRSLLQRRQSVAAR
jgi:hypothetical protein